jgi:L,D-transpeptidase catalytic domain
MTLYSRRTFGLGLGGLTAIIGTRAMSHVSGGHALDAQAAGSLDRAPALMALCKSAITQFKPARTAKAIVCDYNQPSNLKRLYIFDFVIGSVTTHLVAHGRGSDRGDTWTPRSFNGVEGSNTSITGAMLGAERYQGDHGLSLRLDGLEPTSILARPRDIVVHTAPYMEADFVAANRRPGRSFGCFVVQASVLEEVVATLENGGLLVSVGA